MCADVLRGAVQIEHGSFCRAPCREEPAIELCAVSRADLDGLVLNTVPVRRIDHDAIRIEESLGTTRKESSEQYRQAAHFAEGRGGPPLQRRSADSSFGLTRFAL